MNESMLISVLTVFAAAFEQAAGGGAAAQAPSGGGAGAGVDEWAEWASGPVAAVVLGALAWSGVLSSSALERGPRRDIGLSVWDALIGLWLWFCGALLGGGLLRMWSAPEGDGASGSEAMAVDAANPGTVLLLQLATFGPPVLWFLWRAGCAPRGFGRAGLVPRRWKRDIVVAVVALPVGVLLVTATQSMAYEVAKALGDPPPMVQHDFLNAYVDMREGRRWVAMAMLTLSTVVMAPVCEEVFNRGLLQTALLSWLGAGRRWMVIGIASLFFAMLHVGAVPIAALPALFVLGVLFGWLYERTGSLWPSILVHAGFNGLNVMYVLSAVE